MFVGQVPGDLAAVAAALINVGLHAGLDVRLRRRAAWLPLAVTALLFALPLTLAGTAWWHTRQATDDLNRQLRAAVPAEVWRIDQADLGDPDCAFCLPVGLSAQANQLVSPGATEPQLLAASTARSARPATGPTRTGCART